MKEDTLEDIPLALRRVLLERQGGDLRQRIAAGCAMFRALIRGETPDVESLDWLNRSFMPSFAKMLSTFGTAEQCREDPVLASSITRYYLGLESVLDDLRAEYRTELSERALVARGHRVQSREYSVTSLGPLPSIAGLNTLRAAQESLTSTERESIERVAEQMAAESLALQIDTRFAPAIQQIARGHAEQTQCLCALGKMYGISQKERCDTLPGKTFGTMDGLWQDNGLLAKLSQLSTVKKLIARLGEYRPDDRPHPRVLRGPGDGLIAERLVPRETTRGNEQARSIESVTLSDQIARMLPSEAMKLMHPTLRWLWHAKRVEGTLQTWKSEGVRVQNVRAVVPSGFHPRESVARGVRGAVIACIDTSGSMRGAPEQAAKGIALLAAQVARSGSRPCVLYNFSGPNEFSEIDIRFDARGMEELLEWLTHSFHGGTVLNEVMERTLKRLPHKLWRGADVVVLTDGHFELDAEIKKAMCARSENVGTRFHLVLLPDAGIMKAAERFMVEEENSGDLWKDHFSSVHWINLNHLVEDPDV